MYLMIVNFERTNILNARNRFLRFYDKISLHDDFKNVNKTDFKKLRKRFHNQHSSISKKNKKILNECFTFIESSSKKIVCQASTVKSVAIVKRSENESDSFEDSKIFDSF